MRRERYGTSFVDAILPRVNLHARRTSSLDRAWRLIATAICYTEFGIAALALALVVLPLARLVPGSELTRRTRARRAISAGMRGFLRLAVFLGAITQEYEGLERLGRPGQLILANHPTLIDAVIVLAAVPDLCCVAKQALWRNPFTRAAARAAGCVSNSPTDQMIEGAADALRQGQSVIMFPEGTRTMPGQPLQFHRGAAAIAIRAARVVTPVYMSSDPPTLGKHQPWYRIPERRIRFAMRAGSDIDPEPFRRGAPAPLAGREFNRHLLELFTRELARSP